MPEEVHSTTVNMFFMEFLNAGIVIQLVYFNWLPSVKIPVLLAEFDRFSQEWYIEVGTTIVITLMLMVLTPNVSNAVF